MKLYMCAAAILLLVFAAPAGMHAQQAESLTAESAAPDSSSSNSKTAVSYNVFISGTPLGAAIYLDGTKLDKRTPVFIRGLPAGRHELLLRKDGYVDRSESFELAGNSVFEPRLVSFREALNFRNQRSLDGIRLALPLFIGTSAVLAAREIVWPHQSDLPVEPELLADAAVSGGLLIWGAVLEVQKSRYVLSLSETPAPPLHEEEEAEKELASARATMSEGNFEDALAIFDGLSRSYPETRSAAFALYESARLSFILGGRQRAEMTYLRLIDDYPLPEIYDRAVKGLSDCRLASGDPVGAVELLGAMSGCGTGYSPGEIELFRESILKDQNMPAKSAAPQDQTAAPTPPAAAPSQAAPQGQPPMSQQEAHQPPAPEQPAPAPLPAAVP